MKTIIRKTTWKAIYRLLDRVSPVDYDCGLLCGATCCTYSGDLSDEDMGIYLYPGEEKLHDVNSDWLSWSVERAEDYEFPNSWSGKIYFVRCKNPPHCPRHMRPFQCRTYPLTPHLTEDGVLTLIKNQEELPYTCPLVANDVELSSSFIQATYTAWSHLIRDPLIYDLVEMDSRVRDQMMEY